MQRTAGRWAVLSGLAGLSGLMVVMVGLGSPSAAANLATLSLSATNGRAGLTIALTGASFTVPRPGTGLAATPVVVHWQSETGPVVAQADPDRFGSISAVFVVPADAKPGNYVVVATQLTPRRAPDAPADQAASFFAEPGTPARASFEVLGVGARPAVVRSAPAAEPVDPKSDLDSTVWVVLTAAFGAVAMSLFGGGLIAFIHQSRQSKLSAEARWIPPGWYR